MKWNGDIVLYNTPTVSYTRIKIAINQKIRRPGRSTANISRVLDTVGFNAQTACLMLEQSSKIS